ncbi:hypothetical protein C343_00339 [Cryptococcus neoformans C23]|uniref:Type 2A phosphatase-associated protein 42 n=1 Tax=Cryptococcus neoformans (strain H99 / ATCC 208821 / CBS 10515 / FGSC 9487) TaxID=235443 RepID=J9VIR8_CRYN9|nr:hypothetical protein CNAG_00335 [Cryptococcus neoformans var. grubii H99]AUB21902.1 hypothetical protein CKF44_00335 [Cryptococcus neoformans var. grubii]OWZ37056.1 hypothetical protein C347_00416 [Cryptococcus neoformans var. grubii AD2-60a]OWZ48887.1 hypothetical protein C343_00339 [Cryptococcus neoformans var. grubii C23]OXC87309.1 hypothetical protein C344_00351 [Cryptococcus neoformans var. grubii AD1-7a]AFR92469.1 hypothetical protein CNAG_00335 [Cryptococcus neoformans var. grubii H9|eukprot:XP_012046660.1 hypothetical protein CNAG_00335 [Cryptococcus neoformans var. grubii H99]
MSDLPLPQFYSHSLIPLIPIFDDTLSLSSPEAQSILSIALDNLYLIQRMLTSLGVFSENESVSETSNGQLLFMSIGWAIGSCEEKRNPGSMSERKEALLKAEYAFQTFVELLCSYGVLSSQEASEYSEGNRTDLPNDPAKKREAKINQYKREKELREKINAVISRRKQVSASTPVSFLISLLPEPPAEASAAQLTQSQDVNEDDMAEESRETIIDVLRLLYSLALSSMASMKMELDILSSAPPVNSSPGIPHADPRQGGRGENDDTWRLDQLPTSLTRSSDLISTKGKVLRPFTILPSNSGVEQREKLKAGVFKQSWRLPTMTIDEYLDIEKQRGNMITGGGQESYDKPTDSELLELDSEMDGTWHAEQQAEHKREKDERWAQYTDDNPKGYGNTTNKG